MIQKAKMLSSLVLATALLSGCATSQLQTSAKMTQSVFINPVAKDKRTIFINMKNTSGAPINLSNSIMQELTSKGYTLSDDPEASTYILMANVLYCDKKQENNVGTGAGMGGIAGAVANSGSNGKSMAVAGLAGMLVGGAIAKATEDTIYQMQVDIVIREKAKGKVTTTTGNVAGQASVHDGQKAGFMNSFAGQVRNTDASGQLQSNMANSNAQTYETDFIEHKTMMFAEATKMNLTLEEATPILERKIATQIGGLF